MKHPILHRSYKRAFPFRIGTTSYIYPGPILFNVQRLAPFMDEIELLLFESDHLPDAGEIEAIAGMAEATELTFNVHLPLDVTLGHNASSRRMRSVAAVKEALMRTASLMPSSACLHLEPGKAAGVPEAMADWKLRCSESLQDIAHWRGNLNGIVVENLSYPLEWIEDLIEQFDISVCLDVGHLFRYGFDAESTYGNFVDRIAIVHLHGVAGTKDHLGLDRLSPEHRMTMLRMLKGFTKVVSIEVFAFDALASSLAALERWKNDL